MLFLGYNLAPREFNRPLCYRALMSGQFPPTLRPQRHASPSTLRTKPPRAPISLHSEDSTKNGKLTLDLTQRLERKLAEYNASNNVFKRWLLEIVTWTTSALCMFAVVGIYLHVNGRLMSRSEQLLNFASILGKVASAALIVPTSEALGQLKWNWFNKSNAMWDFEIFDKATRGPWGAALLLYRTKGQSLAALGALLIVLLLAIDTFFQQVTTYPLRWTPADTNGSIPRVVRYTPFYTPEFQQGFETTFVNPAIRPVVGQFFIDNGTQPIPFGNGTRAEVPLTCPTGDCSWQQYETLAVCSKCTEVPNIIDWACLFTRVDWSADQTGELSEAGYSNATVCGYFLNATSSEPVLMSGYVADDNTTEVTVGEALLVRTLPLTEMITKRPIYGGSIRFRDIVNPIFDSLIVSASDGVESIRRKDKPSAYECVLAWCVQTLRSSYNSGIYSEEVISTFVNTSTETLPSPWESFPVEDNGEVIGTVVLYTQDIHLRPTSQVNDNNNSSNNSTPSNGFFGTDNTTASNILQAFDDYFPSYYTARPPHEKPMLRYKNYLGGPSLRKLAFNPLLAPNNISHHMERLATALTNTIRSDTRSYDSLQGPAYVRLQFVSVCWAWLIFPFALLLLSLIFLVSTILKTSEDGATEVWKTSAMPALIYSLPEEARMKFTGSAAQGSPYKEAKKVRVRLLPNHGWRLSVQGAVKSPLLVARKSQPPPDWI